MIPVTYRAESFPTARGSKFETVNRNLIGKEKIINNNDNNLYARSFRHTVWFSGRFLATKVT